MRVARRRVWGLCLWLLACAGGMRTAASAEPLDDARALYRQRRYAEARVLLEPLAAAEPANPPACYFLGMTLLRAGGPSSLDSARTWLGRAVRLAPKNGTYLSDYAGVCLLMADRDNSFSLAIEGSHAMERAVALDPGDLDARDGLMRFYAKAPWPLGDPEKALLQAAEIAKRDPKRGASAYLAIAAVFEKAGRRQLALSATKAAQDLASGPAH